MVFAGRGFTSRGQESGSVFSAAMCKIQASKHYVEPLPLVLKIEAAASHKVKGSLYSCLLIATLPSRSRMLNWILEIIYSLTPWLLSSFYHRNETEKETGNEAGNVTGNMTGNVTNHRVLAS